MAVEDSPGRLFSPGGMLSGFLDINERGIRAAGATAFFIHQEYPEDIPRSGLRPRSLPDEVPPPQPKPINFVASRPFFIFIRDNKFKRMMFSGGLFGSHDFSFNQAKKMSVGPWGGSGGEKWVYHPNQPIKKIIICHGDVIDSITFVDADGEQSTRFGGTGGHNTHEVILDNPKERLTAISGTFEWYWNMYVIKSLTFATNISVYGPFGVTGNQMFSVPMEAGSIVGFHGRAGTYLDAIGVIVNNISPPKVMQQVQNPISFGPWGGSGGDKWIYQPNRPIKKIIIRHGDIIDSITFMSTDGSVQRFGGAGGHRIGEVLLDKPGEYLTAISGTFDWYYGHYIIKSLTFTTNISVYGPFGTLGKQTFSVPMDGRTLLGFHGRAGHYLDAIGVTVKDTSPPKVVEEIVKPITIGPWGGSGGEKWIYHPNQPIEKIIITRGDVIDSITFVSKDGATKRFGGTGGHYVHNVILGQGEYLTSISGTFERFYGPVCIKSLAFSTNVTRHGPFGVAGNQAFSVPLDGGAIVGFHGRAGSYLDAIGVIV